MEFFERGLTLVDAKFNKRVFGKPIILTERDYEVLRFVLNMKFSSVDEIYQKFFSVTKKGEQSISDLWARERVSHLRERGFLKRHRVYTESKSYYQVTPGAVKALRQKFIGEYIGGAPSGIDFQSFEHDKIMLEIRLKFEERFVGCSWISDKQLNEDVLFKESLERELRPDGILICADGKRVAVELEIAAKAKKRYRDKVQGYINHIRGNSDRHFESVYFLCAKELVFDLLEDETEIYGELFAVNTLGGFWEG